MLGELVRPRNEPVIEGGAIVRGHQRLVGPTETSDRRRAGDGEPPLLHQDEEPLQFLGEVPVDNELAFVLGPLLEMNLRKSLILSQGNFSIFITRPLAACALILALVILLTPPRLSKIIFLAQNSMPGKNLENMLLSSLVAFVYNRLKHTVLGG